VDGARFDQLSRSLARRRTRRQGLKAIAGAAVAVVAGARRASAQACTAHYSPCAGDEECCSGSVCQYGLCMPGCRIDGAYIDAWMSPPENICGQCRPELSTTSLSPVNEGVSCWSGDPNAGATFCQNGACAPTGPAQCPPPDACHTDELIDPATCTYAVAEAGTPCGIEAMCHGGFYQPADACDGNGFCIGGGSRTEACIDNDHCDPAVGCFGCLTDSECQGGGDACNTVACVDHQCVVTGHGGACGSYTSGCGEGSCSEASDGLTTCARTIDQESVCVGDWLCSGDRVCASSAECGEGRACIVDSCCGVPQCVRICGSDVAEITVMSDFVERPTAGPGMTGMGN